MSSAQVVVAAPLVAPVALGAAEVALEGAQVGTADALMARLQPHMAVALTKLDISALLMATVASSSAKMLPLQAVLELRLLASQKPSASDEQLEVAELLAAETLDSTDQYPKPLSSAHQL